MSGQFNTGLHWQSGHWLLPANNASDVLIPRANSGKLARTIANISSQKLEAEVAIRVAWLIEFCCDGLNVESVEGRV